MLNLQQLWGIDFGSKKAGTTAICFWHEHALDFRQSCKNEDADKMLLDMLGLLKPKLIMIDAPLSLPRAYNHSANENADYFYRQCDRALKAMSPMFLGGLTARAIQFKHKALALGVEVIETYPAAQAKKLCWDQYKKQPCQQLALKVTDQFSVKLKRNIENHHQLDALLAFIAGMRYISNEHETIGDKEEGVIII